MLASLACLGFSLSSHAAPVPGEDTAFDISLGAERSTRSLLGAVSDKPRWVPSVGVNYRSGRFFASTERGLGYTFFQNGGLTGFVAMGVDPGRKLGDSTLSPRLVGMGKVESSGLGMLGVNYQAHDGLISLTAVQVTSTASSQGSQTLVSAVVNVPVWGDALSGYVSLAAAYADRKHAQTFYGVTPEQAARSGNPVYAAGAGWISCDTTVGLNYAIDRHWSAGASVGRHERLGAAAQGPLFATRASMVGSVSVGYRF